MSYLNGLVVFPHFLQFKSKFGNKKFMIWAIKYNFLRTHYVPETKLDILDWYMTHNPYSNPMKMYYHHFTYFFHLLWWHNK